MTTEPPIGCPITERPAMKTIDLMKIIRVNHCHLLVRKVDLNERWLRLVEEGIENRNMRGLNCPLLFFLFKKKLYKYKEE